MQETREDTGKPSGYEFGPFRVDAHGGAVYRDESRLSLPPKAVDLLRLLLAAGGEVVTRGDLHRDLWPDVVVEDGNITKLVFQLREALAEVPEYAHAIETVPKRGYRFVAPVQALHNGARSAMRPSHVDVPQPPPVLAPDVEPPADAPQPPALHAPDVGSAAPRSEAGQKTLWIAGGGMIVAAALVALAVTVSSRDTSRTQPPALDPHAIAVLPFRTLGGDQTDVYFGEGLAEDIVTHLSKVPGLHVVSRASTARYQGAPPPLSVIGAELHVGSLIEGSVQRSGERTRIAIQLTDTRNGRHLWAETYDRELRDVLDVQSDIATKVAAALAVAPATTARLGSTANAEAYDLYLRALSDLDHWGDGDRLGSAIRNLNAAIGLDPRFASAYAQLGLAEIRYGYRLGGTSWVKPASDAADRALEIEPGLAIPHVVKSQLLYSWPGHWDAEGAIRELRLAQQLEPGVGHLELGELFAHLGLEEPALREINLALSFDPLSDWTRDRAIATAAWLAHWDDALAQGRGWFPDEQLIARPSWRAALHLGQAADVFREAVPADRPPQALNHAMLATAVLGRDPERARALIDRMVKSYPNHPSTNWHHLMYDIACAEALTGNPDAAVAWLRRAAEGGFPAVVLFSRDSFLDSIRTHPGYIELMSELRPRWERMRAQYGQQTAPPVTPGNR